MLFFNRNTRLFSLILILIFCQTSSPAQINVTEVYDTNPKEAIKENLSDLDIKQNELRDTSKIAASYSGRIKQIITEINTALHSSLDICDSKLLDEIKNFSILIGKFEKQDCNSVSKKNRRKNKCIPSEIVSSFQIPFDDIFRGFLSLYEKDDNFNDISDSCDGFYISGSCKLPENSSEIPQSLILKDHTDINTIGSFDILSSQNGNDTLFILKNNSFIPFEIKIIPGERDIRITQSTTTLPSESTESINNDFDYGSLEFIDPNILVNIPTIISIPPNSQQIAFKECLLNLDENSDFQYNYVFRLGSSTSNHTGDGQYSLPYKTGTSYTIGQEENGTFSHFGFSKDSIDFTMPEGTEITAIRDGTVIAIKEDSNEGGADKDTYIDRANYIWILHDDGSIANYAHLKKDGVLVNLGDKIKEKYIIALSGNTGYSTGPHLHLQLRLPRGFYSNDSIPLRFKGIDGALKEGIAYTSL